jgi:hypothetical protein
VGNKWIVDVLADLRAYAVANNLPVLAGQLAVATAVAEKETGAAAPIRAGEIDNVRQLFGTARTGRRA